MSLRAYLALMGFGTVLASVTFFLVLFRVDVDTAGASGFAMFYVSLFLAITGAISLLSLSVRSLNRRGEMLSRLVGLSFRQAALLSALAVGALALRAYGLLSWWSALLAAAAVTAVEFLFISLDNRPPVSNPES
jgi:hypothetical protein